MTAAEEIQKILSKLARKIHDGTADKLLSSQATSISIALLALSREFKEIADRLRRLREQKVDKLLKEAQK